MATIRQLKQARQRFARRFGFPVAGRADFDLTGDEQLELIEESIRTGEPAEELQGDNHDLME